MAEKNSLQSLKLEISRTFKLEPYERIIFHRILTLLHSDIGIDILFSELERGEKIRSSSIKALSSIENSTILEKFCDLLNSDLTNSDYISIFNYIAKYGNKDNLENILEFLSKKNNLLKSNDILESIFNAILKINSNSELLLDYLKQQIYSNEINPKIKSLSLLNLSNFRKIDEYEKLLLSADESNAETIYRSISHLSNILSTEISNNKIDTFDNTQKKNISSEEDNIILKIRVTLGKMTHHFENYSNHTKIAFLNAMISSNHRESITFIMKSLTSRDNILANMTLYLIHNKIEKLRDHDKLFKNLLAFSTENEEQNNIIVSIFKKYFSQKDKDRNFHLLQERLYSYIIVTLETYFESYRKEFMITNVAEKNYPETFQKIRDFILENFTPEIKKEILSTLADKDELSVNKLIDKIENSIHHIDPQKTTTLTLLFQILLEDEQAKKVSISRLENINFEKRYLRNRITRICKIISVLQIENAAPPLVNIYNYLKKYNDKHLLSEVINTLSLLNYSYMLSEIEVMITTGLIDEQLEGIHLLSLFSEQRSINILMEFIQENSSNESELLLKSLEILIRRDIYGNSTANNIFKNIINVNNNNEIITYSIIGIGLCGLPSDIDFLNDLFIKMRESENRDTIVMAIGNILSLNKDMNKRAAIKSLKEFLKDSMIKVRIYSSLILANLGSSDGITHIQNMMIIKNRSIQRSILNLNQNFNSLELSFFIISLLKIEYGISNDIISVLSKLSEENLKEINGFIINIFRKHQSPEFETIGGKVENKNIDFPELENESVTFFYINILKNIENLNIIDIIKYNINIDYLITTVLSKYDAIIIKKNESKIVAFFRDTIKSVDASKEILLNLKQFNKNKGFTDQFHFLINLKTDSVQIINNEILSHSEYKLIDYKKISLYDKIICDKKTYDLVSEKYYGITIPYLETIQLENYYEIFYLINFKDIANNIKNEIIAEEKEKIEKQKELEKDLKKLRLISRSNSSISIANDLDNIGKKLQIQLEDLERYIIRRSTDRELNKNVRKIIQDTNNLFALEVSKIIIE